ncbi:MAG: SWIM zinc finger family protein [Aureliella sp.]
MVQIDEAFILAAAPNGDSAKNGRALAIKKSFRSLHHSEDQTLLFGYCQGSGKTPYLCSADFSVPEKPVYRCSCPSRLFPCKHSIGLLYCKVEGHAFTAADVPDELATKREKAKTQAEKKKIEADKPRQVNKSALAKKIKAQLEGIDLLETLTRDLVRLGIGNMNAKLAKEIDEQAKQLGNAYLPGAQTALRNYTRLFYAEDGAELSNARREAIFSEAFDQLGRLNSLIGRGRTYLKSRLEDPELKPDTETPIAAWLGHAWQLRELKDAGLVQQDVELVQLAFHSHDDVARQELVDTGIWMNLSTGQIGLTQNFRPYRSLKHIKSEDSFFQIAQVPELCIYPGNVNPRIRWDGMIARPMEPRDYARMRQLARSDFAEVIKEVKGHIKAPLADKQPIYALNFARIGTVGDRLVAEDAKGQRLVMSDVGMTDEPRSCHLLPLLPKEFLRGQTLIARFRHDLDTRKLQIKPLGVITDSEVIRLTL